MRHTLVLGILLFVMMLTSCGGCNINTTTPDPVVVECPPHEVAEAPTCEDNSRELETCREEAERRERWTTKGLPLCSDLIDGMDEGPVRDLTYAMTFRLNRETNFRARCDHQYLYFQYDYCWTPKDEPDYLAPPLSIPLPKGTPKQLYITYEDAGRCAVNFPNTGHPGLDKSYGWAPLAQLGVLVVNTWTSETNRMDDELGALQLLYGNIYEGSILNSMSEDRIVYGDFLPEMGRSILTVIHDEERLRMFAPWALDHVDLLTAFPKHSLAARIGELLEGSYPDSKYAADLVPYPPVLEDNWSFKTWDDFERRIRHEDALRGSELDATFIWKTGQKLKAWWLRRWIATGRGQKGADHLVLLRYWAWEVLMLTDPVLADEWQSRILTEMRDTRTLRHKAEYMKALQR